MIKERMRMAQLFSTSKRSCLVFQKQGASVSLLSSRFDPSHGLLISRTPVQSHSHPSAHTIDAAHSQSGAQK